MGAEQSEIKFNTNTGANASVASKKQLEKYVKKNGIRVKKDCAATKAEYVEAIVKHRGTGTTPKRQTPKKKSPKKKSPDRNTRSTRRITY